MVDADGIGAEPVMVEEIIAGADIAEGVNGAVELPLSDAEDRRRL